MPFLCVRIDLDYVPWDTPDAAEFGHGEPAAILRLLALARQTGFKFHFFISNRVMRAFPAAGEAILNDGHDLDWLCKHPEQADDRYVEALALFESLGHRPLGLAVRGAWPPGASFSGMQELKFISAATGVPPPGLRLFPVDSKPLRDVFRAGMGVRTWTDTMKTHVRTMAARNQSVTVSVRPQVLAKYDAHLIHFREIVDLARAVGLPIQTLRDVIA
jgi:hypothetical protein